MRLDDGALALFARKGLEAGPAAPQVGEANGPKVRRVMQLLRDLAGRPLDRLRILDLGCGEGVYAIEAALAGAQVVAIDARTERMRDGAAVAERHGIQGIEFRQEDARRVARATHGGFDSVLCLGLLYHLDAAEALDLLERIRGLCDGLLVIDTLIASEPEDTVELGRHTYRGRWVREHEDDDPEHVRRARVLRSIDTAVAFHFTRASLVDALRAVGFTSVLECHVPPEPEKAADRITLAAVPGEPVSIATYPKADR